MKKYLIAVLGVFFIFFYVISIWNGFFYLFQNILHINNLSSVLSYISVILSAIFLIYYFEKMERNHEDELKKLLHLTSLTSKLNYDNLINIKKIYILDSHSFRIILKTNKEFPVSLNINRIPQSQIELENLDSNLTEII